MSSNKKSSFECLAEVYSCVDSVDPADLQFFITLNPDKELIMEAMERYVTQQPDELPGDCDEFVAKFMSDWDMSDSITKLGVNPNSPPHFSKNNEGLYWYVSQDGNHEINLEFYLADAMEHALRNIAAPVVNKLKQSVLSNREYDSLIIEEKTKKIEELKKELAISKSQNADLKSINLFNEMRANSLQFEVDELKEKLGLPNVVVPEQKEEVKIIPQQPVIEKPIEEFESLSKKNLPFSKWIISKHHTNPIYGAGDGYMKLSEESKKIIDMAIERYIVVAQRPVVIVGRNFFKDEEE